MCPHDSISQEVLCQITSCCRNKVRMTTDEEGVKMWSRIRFALFVLNPFIQLSSGPGLITYIHTYTYTGGTEQKNYKFPNWFALVSIWVEEFEYSFNTRLLYLSLQKFVPAQNSCQLAPDACQPVREQLNYFIENHTVFSNWIKSCSWVHKTAQSSLLCFWVNYYPPPALLVIFVFVILKRLRTQCNLWFKGLFPSLAAILDRAKYFWKTSSLYHCEAEKKAILAFWSIRGVF